METIRKPDYLQQDGVSDGSELTPAEVAAKDQLDDRANANATGDRASGLKQSQGFTHDQEGRTNVYASTPEPYVQSKPRFGWTKAAERLNGRLAMIGFVALVITELVTQKGLISILTSSI